MNTRDELYQLARAVNDANFSVIVECMRMYERATYQEPIPEHTYEDVLRAIGTLQMAVINLNTAIIAQQK